MQHAGGHLESLNPLDNLVESHLVIPFELRAAAEVSAAEVLASSVHGLTSAIRHHLVWLFSTLPHLT